MDDVDRRLSEAEGRAGELLERLEQLRTAEEELAATTQEVRDFVARVRVAVEPLSPAVDALRAVTEVTRQSDPAELLAALKDLKERSDGLAEEIQQIQRSAEAAATRADEVGKRFGEQKRTLLKELRDVARSLSDRIAEAEATLAPSIAAVGKPA